MSFASLLHLTEKMQESTPLPLVSLNSEFFPTLPSTSSFSMTGSELGNLGAKELQTFIEGSFGSNEDIKKAAIMWLVASAVPKSETENTILAGIEYLCSSRGEEDSSLKKFSKQLAEVGISSYVAVELSRTHHIQFPAEQRMREAAISLWKRNVTKEVGNITKPTLVNPKKFKVFCLGNNRGILPVPDGEFLAICGLSGTKLPVEGRKSAADEGEKILFPGVLPFPNDLVAFLTNEGDYDFPSGHPARTYLEKLEEKDLDEIIKWHPTPESAVWTSGAVRLAWAARGGFPIGDYVSALFDPNRV